MSDNALPCIVCKKQLKTVWGDERWPSEGTAFHTEGHYGSTVFDPMDLSSLVIAICDECLTEAGRAERVLLAQDRIGIEMEDGLAAGYYCPPREPVVWSPDQGYSRQKPLRVSFEEVGTKVTESVMWKGSAIEAARKRIEADS